MNALEILALIVVLPIGLLFVIGGVALSLFGDWENTPGVRVGHHEQPQPATESITAIAPAQRPRTIVHPTAHAA